MTATHDGPSGAVLSIDRIRSDFEVLDDWEDRYRYIIDLGRALPPLAPELHNDITRVRGCASQVWLHTDLGKSVDGVTVMRFTGDSDALIVKGLVALVLSIYDGHTPAEVLSRDARAILAALGLQANLSQQRSNGLNAMIDRIEAEARKAQSEG
jgi:cysteine desulfuration protein SufE